MTMTTDTRRITLVTRAACSPQRGWNTSFDAANRIIFLKAYSVLRYALGLGVAEMQQDVERVILDHSSTASEFLDLLTTLPAEFTGDVLLIRDDDSGFLSATGRGGDRVLYALSAHDIEFYLDTHGLLAPATYQELKSA
jgi:hypothetical protein